MSLSVGASPDDLERLAAMLRVVGRFGHQLGQLCDDCVAGLEDAARPASGGADDDRQSPPD